MSNPRIEKTKNPLESLSQHIIDARISWPEWARVCRQDLTGRVNFFDSVSAMNAFFNRDGFPSDKIQPFKYQLINVVYVSREGDPEPLSSYKFNRYRDASLGSDKPVSNESQKVIRQLERQANIEAEVNEARAEHDKLVSAAADALLKVNQLEEVLSDVSNDTKRVLSQLGVNFI